MRLTAEASAAADSKPPRAASDWLGFVELDAYARGLVGPAARARAKYGGGTLIPLFSNSGFMPFLRNLICSMRRLRVHNWMVIAMDNETCPLLMGQPGLGEQSACVYPYQSATGSVAASTSPNGIAVYRSVAFNRMVMQRPLWVRWLLEQGYSVIQCDLDIVWVHDPQPLLRDLRVWKPPPRKSDLPQPDMLFQSEQAYGLNGGFYFARPTNRTLAFFSAWLERLTAMVGTPSFEEQHALNSAMHAIKKTSQLVIDVLPERLFPNGKIWWSYPWMADKRDAYIVHANWNKQQKKSRMARDRLWFLEPGDGRCASDFDPFQSGCTKLCAPVAYSAPGSAKIALKGCRHLNREDDAMARRHGSHWERHNHTWPSLRGQFWHPDAYAAIPGCVRNTSIVAPYAALAHEQLRSLWAEDAQTITLAPHVQTFADLEEMKRHSKAGVSVPRAEETS